MIFQALDIIRAEVSLGRLNAVLGNIGEILSNSNNVSDSDIIMSLINLEENRVSRDPQNYVKEGSEFRLKNPAINLNLSVLFTPYRPEGYGLSIQSLQEVIEFFQKKHLFDHLNTPDLHPGIEKLILEMVSLNFEQLQQLWSMLGGKYQPSIIYKIRMVTIDSVSSDGSKPINEIETNYYAK
ncbi:MAG TPA: DUF4255 domain-containing protein [Mariniphaga sp.]|nr:DUF4255 domain-containing protein [Mariniphaga sp.]